MSQSEVSYPIWVSEKQGYWIKKDAGPIRRWWNSPSAVGRGQRYLQELSPVRWITEKMSPEFADKMETLRQVDNQIFEWTKDLRNVLDRAQDAKKFGRFLDAIFWLGQINNRLKLVGEQQGKISDLQPEDLARYFTETEQGIPGDYFETGENKLVQAGLLDDLGRQISTWKLNQEYRKKILEQDRALIRLLNLAKATVNRCSILLKGMGHARGKGNISQYLELLAKVSQQQMEFERTFKSIYEQYFAAMVAKVRERQEADKIRDKQIRDNAEQAESKRIIDQVEGSPEFERIKQDIANGVASSDIVDYLNSSVPKNSITSDLLDKYINLKSPTLVGNNTQDPSSESDSDLEEVASKPRNRTKKTPKITKAPKTPLRIVSPKQVPLKPTEITEETPEENTGKASPQMEFSFNGNPIKPSPVETIPTPMETPEVVPSQPIEKPVEEIVLDLEPESESTQPVETKPESVPEVVPIEPQSLPEVVKPKSKPAKIAPNRRKHPKGKKASELDSIILKNNHTQFFNSLKSMAELDNPYLLATAILAYSEKIDQSDPQTALQLLAIAEGLLNSETSPNV